MEAIITISRTDLKNRNFASHSVSFKEAEHRERNTDLIAKILVKTQK